MAGTVRRAPAEPPAPADLAIQVGSKLYTDSASSYRLITGYDLVNRRERLGGMLSYYYREAA